MKSRLTANVAAMTLFLSAGASGAEVSAMTVTSSDPTPPKAQERVTTIQCGHAIVHFTVADAQGGVSYVISRPGAGADSTRKTGKLSLGDSIASGRNLSRVGYACVGDGVLVHWLGATPKTDGSLDYRTWTSVVRPDGTEVVIRNEAIREKDVVEALN